MSADPSAFADTDTTNTAETRKPWAKPQVITASVAKQTLGSHTFKSTPTVTDYTTGSTHVGS
jgi:hypothetical protein